MIANWIRRLKAWARGGTPEFNQAELSILSAVLNHLDEPQGRTLASQIESVELVQRQHPGRLVVAYYRDPRSVQELPYPGYEHCLADVIHKSPEGVLRTTSVVLHNGRLMTLERDVPGLPSDVYEIVSVELHPKNYSSEAAAIDSEVHGSAA